MTATAPDLILTHGDIRTMDALQPRAEALAVRDGRIVAIGGNDEIAALANGRTKKIHAGGKLVLPGFQDTHIHLQDSGTGFSSSVNLERARTIQELQQIIRDYAKTTNDLWVRGTGWYSGIFGAHNLDRHALDAAVPDRPVYIYASDGHNAAMNSKACELTGLDASVADPHGGSFVRDEKGVPTGLIYEDAIDWARARMPKKELDAYTKGVRYGQELCNRHGITGVLDAMVAERHMKVYRGLEEAGELSVRLRATAKVYPEESVKDALGRLEALRRDYRSENIAVHSAKFFLDGVLENRTAAMIEDYSDAIGGNAPIMFDEDHLRELFIAFDAARFQLHMHVIGDRATRVALDRIEAARVANGAWPSLHQLAHVQVIDPADIPRLRQLGVVTNMQPLWARCEPSVSDVALPFIGAERGRWMYPWRTIVDSGALYAVSSDWGVSTLNPFPIMQTAVTRQPAHVSKDFPVFEAQERMKVEQVVRGYTTLAAAAAWRADETGSLTPGKYADIVILDRDIFTVDPYAIGETEVELTLLGGREVHRAEGFAG
ncbi:amidohydrolase [Dongia sp.]|uniref:amidohydrolase n=1 Tax=Dongia sp. TaxID=1977262 RepID=UPI0035B1E954